MLEFAVELAVRDSELDQYGVVNNAVYLNYFQHARHEMLAALGLPAQEVAQAGRALAVSEMTIRYRLPLRSRDRFRVSAAISQVTGARIMFAQAIHRLPDDKLVADVSVVAVMLDERGRPQRIPLPLKERFVQAMQGE